jgi:hypothetical protein
MMEAYKYDWDGSCMPGNKEYYDWQKTFSIGVFQWVPTKDGKGMKRSKVIKRFRGLVKDQDKVIEKAKAFIREMEGER